MKRKRNDAEGWKKGVLGKYIDSAGVKPGSGFDYGDAGMNPKGCGKYTTDDAGLTNKLPDDGTAPASKDIYDNVRKNSLDDDAGGSRPGPIKYGVD